MIRVGFLPLVVIILGLLVSHEMGMAMCEHVRTPEPVAQQTDCGTAVEGTSAHHGRHQESPDVTNTADGTPMSPACRDVELVTPTQRYEYSTPPDACLAVIGVEMPAPSMIVETRALTVNPPIHPPDRERSLYQVYRI